MTDPESVRVAARRWWLAKRPVGWTKVEHLQNPAVNCSSDRDIALAMAVAHENVDERGRSS